MRRDGEGSTQRVLFESRDRSSDVWARASADYLGRTVAIGLRRDASAALCGGGAGRSREGGAGGRRLAAWWLLSKTLGGGDCGAAFPIRSLGAFLGPTGRLLGSALALIW